MAIPFIFTKPNVVLAFEVLMAMTVNVTALWAVTPCSLVDITEVLEEAAVSIIKLDE
jgi:hypothetical protein